MHTVCYLDLWNQILYSTKRHTFDMALLFCNIIVTW